ncbi:MAG: LytTR family transcriptional regulator DNA-binding domain-containing protein [Firmicutes bacterium]|nr:LytTR family transcriptional regulator DNA-binding domain-containing protein [Bacillota bacterium]
MNQEYLLVLTTSLAARIRIKDVIYIERDKRKIRIITDLEEYEYYERLENLEPMLDRRFFACLKGCYINLEKVVSMRNQKITFQGGQVLYLGKENFLKTMQYYKDYLKNPSI